MKYMTILMVVALLTVPTAAQDGDRIVLQYSKPGEAGTLHASLINGGMVVRGTTGKDIVITARPREHQLHRDQDAAPSRGGLKRITKRAVGLTVEEQDNRVNIKADSIHRAVDLEIEVPRNTSLHLKCINGGDIEITDIRGDLEVQNINGNITAKGISGSVVGHSLNGKLWVVFTQVDPDKAMSFSTLNGIIDVTFPADLAANFKLESQNGEIYTGFEMEPVIKASRFEKNDRENGGAYRLGIERAMHAEINGGGPEIDFKSMMGDIYIRKVP